MAGEQAEKQFLRQARPLMQFRVLFFAFCFFTSYVIEAQSCPVIVNSKQD